MQSDQPQTTTMFDFWGWARLIPNVMGESASDKFRKS